MAAQTEEMVPVFIIAAVVASLATSAFANCRSAKPVSGIIADGGTSLGFQLRVGEQRYVIAGLHSERPIAMKSEAISLHPISEPDRYGRIAVMVGQGDSFLQETWLKAGKGIIYSRNLAGECLKQLRKAEDAGRAAKLGWWRENMAFPAENPAAIAEKKGLFAVVSGRILSIGDRKRRLYLNFGQNWAEDFTISVAKTGAGRFNGNVDELIAAQGRRVEVRGLVELARGPLIRLFHVSQIRFLNEPAIRR
ncbi:nuclease [Ahrensia sp. R2A130]|uniref:nuclease n=1 Tax=Ahrensia sp. R2A130 TaxID=744979 RepID=UPI0001E0E0FF|nr:nuclease [Ahrensia sp. R2A130]EFL87985.1 nuclease [Ahrensia sp. R2A130]